MIKLNSKSIKPATISHLASIQNTINIEPNYEDKIKKAKVKWDGKNSSSKAKLAFNDIKESLLDMCVGIDICVYCEQNEATDIEHIFPKRLYPEKSFTWDNYVLACGKCNTHYKKDKFQIFDPRLSTNEKDITTQKGIFIEPANDDALFIDPRKENPMDFLELDLVNKQYIFTEKYSPGTREYKKAKYTKDLLGLNIRATLIENRKKAARFLISRLEKYEMAKSSKDFNELKKAIDDDMDSLDVTKNFSIEKDKVLKSIKDDILSNPHPTVWKELIRQRNNLNKTYYLFTKVPEALTW